MVYKFFKHKKRDVVQYIIVLAVVTIILAFAFPKIRDKMGNTTNNTLTNINTSFDSNALNNGGGTPQPPAPPQPTTITEDFSDASYNFPITGSWYASSGVFRGQSIGNNNDTASIITLNVPSGNTGTLDFDYWVSSEQNWDFLRVYLDSTNIVTISGENSGHFHKTGLSSGNHALAIHYSKDDSVSDGDDMGYIDNLNLVLNPN